jgi:ribosomal protein S27E
MVRILTLTICPKCKKEYIVYGEDVPDGKCPKCEEEENPPKT